MATALKDARIHLSDPKLFREQNYIDGAWVGADSRKTIEVTDPATGEVIGTVPNAGVAETDGRSRRPRRRCRPGGPRPPRSGRRSCASGST